MYDDDNLPSGIAPWQASDMGILPTDDRHIAIGKAQLYESEQQLQAMRRQREAEAAQPGTAPVWQPMPGNRQATGAVVRKVPVANQELSFDKLYDTRHLAQFIETRRHNAQFTGKLATPNVALRSKMAWAVFAVCLLIVVMGIKLPLIPYQFMTVEYFAVRILLAASVIYGFSLRGASRKPVNLQEEAVTLEGRAMLDALEKNYDFKKPDGSGPRTSSHLLGGYEVPVLPITPQFVQGFSQAYRAATGKNIAYNLYRFNQSCEKRWFLSPTRLDQGHQDSADYVRVDMNKVLDEAR